MQNKRYFNYIVFVTGLVYLLYIVIRVIKIPITHDESVTSMLVEKNTWYALVTYDYEHGFISANNHVLNSILAKFFTKIFGVTPFSLRLGSILATSLYLWVGYLFIKNFITDWKLALVSWILWISNPYLAEFQGLARGYAMAVSFEAGAIFAISYFLKKNTNENSYWYRYFILGCFSAFCAVWSNFVALNFFVVFSGTLFLYAIYRLKFWQALIVAVTGVLLALIIYDPLQAIKKNGDFGWFGNSSFYKDTIGGIVDVTLMGEKYLGDATILSGQVFLTFLFVTTLFVFIALFRRNHWQLSADAWIVILFPSTILANLIITNISSSSYLSSRTTLFFFPLIILSLIIVLQFFSSKFKYFSYATLVLGGSSLLNFLFNVNLTHTYEWAYDRDTYTILRQIEEDYLEEKRSEPFDLRVYCFEEPSFQFYMRNQGQKYNKFLEPIREVPRQVPIPVDTTADYYYIERQDLKLFTTNYEQLWQSKDNQRILLRKR